MPHIELALELDPFSALLHSLYAAILNYHGRYDEAITSAQAALAIQPDMPIAGSQPALALAVHGKHDEHLAWQRRPNLPFLGRPYWGPLRSYPRFQDLFRRIGLTSPGWMW